MLGIHDLALFILSGLLLNMMPGPDSLLIMLRSGSQGWRAGSMAALGIGTGTMVHVLAAALGLSALLSASAELFAVIKLMGALYLVYLGLSMFRQGEEAGYRLKRLCPCLCSPMAGSSGKGCSPMCSTPRWPCSSLPLCPSSSRQMRRKKRWHSSCWAASSISTA